MSTLVDLGAIRDRLTCCVADWLPVLVAAIDQRIAQARMLTLELRTTALVSDAIALPAQTGCPTALSLCPKRKLLRSLIACAASTWNGKRTHGRSAIDSQLFFRVRQRQL
jgi:hypothetical protein